MNVDINKLKEHQEEEIEKTEKKLEELDRIQNEEHTIIKNIADGYLELYYRNEEVSDGIKEIMNFSIVSDTTIEYTHGEVIIKGTVGYSPMVLR